MRVAVIGAGLSGLAAAYELSKARVDVVLYEKDDFLAGLESDFTVYNGVTYPNAMKLLESFGVEVESSDVSFSVSLDEGKGWEWGTRNWLAGLFAQKTNAINPYFWQMLRQIAKFKDDAVKYLSEENGNNLRKNKLDTLKDFIEWHGYSQLFQKAYLLPICTSLWSCSAEAVIGFSAISVLSYFHDNHLFQYFEIFGRLRGLRVRWHSKSNVDKVRQVLESKSCQLRTGYEVKSVFTSGQGWCVLGTDHSEETYDACIISVNAQEALRMLADQVTFEETRILGAFQYAQSENYLHHDESMMPKSRSAWSAWNFLGTTSNGACLTYWLKSQQDLGSLPSLVTINPTRVPKDMQLKWSSRYIIPTVGASKASLELDKVQGQRRVWFCGQYVGLGHQEKGVKTGIVAAHGVLGSECRLLRNPKQMVFSLLEAVARVLVTTYLQRNLTKGCMTLLENGGSVHVFGEPAEESSTSCVLKVHSPLFYWKIATQSHLGIADAYISGDFSFVDEQEGLLKFFMILMKSKYSNKSSSKNTQRYLPFRLTTRASLVISSYRESFRKNTVAQAGQNVSYHYDMNSDLFRLTLDETMSYSCAIFKAENEDLKVAQLRKLSIIIQKARINGDHHVLDIGCGWGGVAVEIVKQTGCKYTGITISEEQLKFAMRRAKEAGLEDRITFMLCDYRQLPSSCKYDRIISCEMIEHVGHEHMEDFFRYCESVLADDGVMLLQFIAFPDEIYYKRRQADFIRTYIFRGGCIPCLSRVISAMATASRLCVEHAENIGLHYFDTARCWRNNAMSNRREIRALGFDEKFMRIWEYYFSYAAAIFRAGIGRNYQVVFTRRNNHTVFNDPYKSHPSA